MHEAILFEHSKFSAVSRTISMIAHHWRQPLNAIGILSQDLMEAYQYGELDEKYLQDSVDKTMNIVSTMSKMIDRFRILSATNDTPVTKLISICTKEVSELLDVELASLKVSLNINNIDDFEVKDSISISQALLNLINNAAEISIKRKIELPKIYITTKIESPFYVISITDNCGGIDSNILKSIFEPYVSQEESKAGLGLFFTRLMLEKSLSASINAFNVENGAMFTIKIKMP
jgi:nitrogen fixation/metabolism regulation signal transduction histidine kinase